MAGGDARKNTVRMGCRARLSGTLTAEGARPCTRFASPRVVFAVIALAATWLLLLFPATALATTGDVFGAGVSYRASTYSGHGDFFGIPIDINGATASGGYCDDCRWPLHAPDDGTVTVKSTGYGSGWGNSIIWTSADGKERIFMAHLDSIGKTGAVYSGDVVGYVGDTGYSDGYHLHIERSVNGQSAPLVLSGRTVSAGRFYRSNGPVTHPAPAASDPAVIEDTAAGVTFDRFVPSVSSAYSGGTYIYGRWTGTRIEARFAGTGIAWYGPTQSGYGMADVYIDNSKVATVDCYAPSEEATLSATLWESGALPAGAHTISIRITGAKNEASAGTVVVVDRLVASGTAGSSTCIRANESAGSSVGSWVLCSNTTYTGGTYRYSRWAGSRISYTFCGSKIAWIGPRASNYGRAAIYIDGMYVTTVSQYGTLGWRYRVWESGTLARGFHTIEIRVLGTKVAASSGTIVVVDGWDVTP